MPQRSPTNAFMEPSQDMKCSARYRRVKCRHALPITNLDETAGLVDIENHPGFGFMKIRY